VFSFAVYAHTLAGSAITAETFVPVKILYVCLLLLVCTHHTVVAAVGVMVFFLVFCGLRPGY